MTSPFDLSKHLNEKTSIEFDIKDYSPWMINKIMSNTMDTIFFAEMMNRFYDLDKNIQYDFYFHGIPKGKRFGKYNKVPTINNIVELIMKTYQVNQTVAESYLKIMSEDAVKKLEEKSNEGGTK
jgi:hypothetical protein